MVSTQIHRQNPCSLPKRTEILALVSRTCDADRDLGAVQLWKIFRSTTVYGFVIPKTNLSLSVIIYLDLYGRWGVRWNPRVGTDTWY